MKSHLLQTFLIVFLSLPFSAHSESLTCSKWLLSPRIILLESKHTFESENLIIRPVDPKAEDLKALEQVYADQYDELEFLGDNFPSFINRLSQGANYWEDDVKIIYMPLLIYHKKLNQIIGAFFLSERTDMMKIEIGFLIFSQYRGHAYAKEASEAVVTKIHQNHRPIDFVATTTQDNIASQKTILNIGFAFWFEAEGFLWYHSMYHISE